MLRIGYVNVRGLSLSTWDAVQRLLDNTFDLLFLAETWFVQEQYHQRHRSWVGSTLAPVETPRIGRPSGGMAVIATASARSQMTDWSSTQYIITVKILDQTISAIYFPPSMTVTEMETCLRQVRTVDMVIGDWNTRFTHPSQAGAPGPPERQKLCAEWLRETRLQHLLPTVHPTRPDHRQRGKRYESQLTTDHVFAKRLLALKLLSCRSVHVDTDHRYILVVTIPETICGDHTQADLPRFQTSRLLQPDVQERLQHTFDEVARHDDMLWNGMDVEEVHAQLVYYCQTVCEKILGRRTKSTRSTSDRTKGIHRSPTQTSIQLYKQAAAASQENSIILLTREAERQGIDVVTENWEMYRHRYTSLTTSSTTSSTTLLTSSSLPSDDTRPRLPTQDTVISFTIDEVAAEIRQQDGSKSVGADGIHMRLLQTLLDTSFTLALTRLYRLCIESGQTPRTWNQTEIHLLIKDPTKRKDGTNLRPITLITMFRKVFERLLLQRFDVYGWAHLHPAQAGFRSHYSTCMNAAVVHHLLSSHARSTAVFLDFRSAFDVLDHAILDRLLRRRGCPSYVQRLIRSLMFDGLSSRVLVNDAVTPWFTRTCGVLQGSPLSPYLFNIFIDSLLVQLNRNHEGIPLCLFYADDGVLVTPSSINVQDLLDQVTQWSKDNGIALNVAKCGHLSRLSSPSPLYVDGQEIGIRESYQYLGFPMTKDGIDFETHLSHRMEMAIKRADWLSLYSDTWGAAHRLRIAKQYLMPMFEYGAPLVWAWAQYSSANMSIFTQTTAGYAQILAWVGRCGTARWHLTANLCGLTSLRARFQHLRTAYQLVLEQISSANPLRQILLKASAPSQLTQFALQLSQDVGWSLFRQQSNSAKMSIKATKAALQRYLRQIQHNTIESEALGSKLTAHIPMGIRCKRGVRGADIIFLASPQVLDMLIQYRRGVFLHRCTCRCGQPFVRGHESCPRLQHPYRLSKVDRRRKSAMHQQLGGPDVCKLTDVDYLLDTGQVEKVVAILRGIQAQIRQAYHEDQLAQSDDVLASDHTFDE